MRKIRRIIAPGAWLAALALMAVACSGGLDIRQSYSFDLETMPVQKSIAEGGTAEIRCALVSEGDYAETRYTIRYLNTVVLTCSQSSPALVNIHYSECECHMILCNSITIMKTKPCYCPSQPGLYTVACRFTTWSRLS